MMKFIFSALLLLLSACTVTVPIKPASVPPQATEQTATSFIWRGHGTEPFWSFVADAKQLRFENMGDAPIYFPYSSFSNTGDVRLFKASVGTGAAATSIVIRLRQQACSDGMSDNVYAWQAEVQINGKRLQGCARRGTQAE